MTKLDSLVQISRYYGTNPAYVIAGGGNTSFKNDRELFIKASGISLATIEDNGFVAMSRQVLGEMEIREYPKSSSEREEEVKQDLKKAILYPENLRPSVETSLHNLIGFTYVVHTHPTLINAVMCANDAAKEVEERFGSEALYVEYTDPGYILFKILMDLIVDYRKDYNKDPQVIFLQNHGIFVAANSAREIKAIYDSVESRIRENRDLNLPDPDAAEYTSETSTVVKELFEKRSLLSRAYRSDLGNHFSKDEAGYRKISRPFTPDIIVYCKSNYLFLEKGISAEEIQSRLEEFESRLGYFPKVIVEEGQGLILVEENEKSLYTVLEVFTDMMKISYLSEQFGGPHFMTDEQIAFIDNWEVENYRRKVAKS